ncbi:MAG: hypothetical protein MUE44_17525 [Oscillatoriaceae cyanobacterium Prado104]|jgi:hypothetical protein|nr:hypothetical protein [Oscillatoriaceae cyanobacterium Prado104]
MQPEVSFNKGMLHVLIPVACLEGPIDTIVSANGGKYEDTDDRQLDVNNMLVSFTEGGLAIDGNWHFQARKYLGRFRGKKKYSPWVSIEGSFSQAFNIKVGNGRLFAETSTIDIQGAGEWYPEILYALISRFRINGTVNKLINQELQNFSGMSLQQLLVQEGSALVAEALRISIDDARKSIDFGAVDINVKITDGRLILSVQVD